MSIEFDFDEDPRMTSRNRHESSNLAGRPSAEQDFEQEMQRERDLEREHEMRARMQEEMQRVARERQQEARRQQVQQQQPRPEEPEEQRQQVRRQQPQPEEQYEEQTDVGNNINNNTQDNEQYQDELSSEEGSKRIPSDKRFFNGADIVDAIILLVVIASFILIKYKPGTGNKLFMFSIGAALFAEGMRILRKKMDNK